MLQILLNNDDDDYDDDDNDDDDDNNDDDDDDDDGFETYESIRKIATGKRDSYTTGCLLDYPYFKENYEIIAIDLNKEQTDADPRVIQYINFTSNLEQEIQQCFSLLEKQKKLS